jgi:hypothetical protein
MAELDDPWLIDAMWRAADLARASLACDCAEVAARLMGLDADQLELHIRVLDTLRIKFGRR